MRNRSSKTTDPRFRFDCQTAGRCDSAFSRRDTPEALRQFDPLRKKRAQGKPGARCTRGLVRKIVQKSAHEHTGSAEAVRPSLRNGFTAYNALSPVTGFLATVACGWCRKLDASVGASGPHVFAVRLTHRSSKAHQRPPHPAPRRDDREAPLSWDGTAMDIG